MWKKLTHRDSLLLYVQHITLCLNMSHKYEDTRKTNFYSLKREVLKIN